MGIRFLFLLLFHQILAFDVYEKCCPTGVNVFNDKLSVFSRDESCLSKFNCSLGIFLASSVNCAKDPYTTSNNQQLKTYLSSTSFSGTIVYNSIGCSIASKMETLYVDTLPSIVVKNSKLHPTSFGSLKRIVPVNPQLYCKLHALKKVHLFDVDDAKTAPALTFEKEKELLASFDCDPYTTYNITKVQDIGVQEKVYHRHSTLNHKLGFNVFCLLIIWILLRAFIGKNHNKHPKTKVVFGRKNCIKKKVVVPMKKRKPKPKSDKNEKENNTENYKNKKILKGKNSKSREEIEEERKIVRRGQKRMYEVLFQRVINRIVELPPPGKNVEEEATKKLQILMPSGYMLASMEEVKTIISKEREVTRTDRYDFCNGCVEKFTAKAQTNAAIVKQLAEIRAQAEQLKALRDSVKMTEQEKSEVDNLLGKAVGHDQPKTEKDKRGDQKKEERSREKSKESESN